MERKAKGRRRHLSQKQSSKMDMMKYPSYPNCHPEDQWLVPSPREDPIFLVVAGAYDGFGLQSQPRRSPKTRRFCWRSLRFRPTELRSTHLFQGLCSMDRRSMWHMGAASSSRYTVTPDRPAREVWACHFGYSRVGWSATSASQDTSPSSGWSKVVRLLYSARIPFSPSLQLWIKPAVWFETICLNVGDPPTKLWWSQWRQAGRWDWGAAQDVTP